MTDNTLTLDCIIFGLQRFGGISNYWAKLVRRAISDPLLACQLVIPKDPIFGEFDDEWLARKPLLRERLNAQIMRYLPGSTNGKRGVFHTSYYRLPRQQVDKYVVSVYDFTYERYRRGLARFVHSRQKFKSIARADAVLCISEATRADVIEFCPDIDQRKVEVVHLGVDLDTFHQDTPVNPAHSQFVLFIGQRAGYKRFDIAVDAVRQNGELTLGIVGPKLDIEECVMLQRRLGTRWHEFGPVTSAALRGLYSSAHAFIFPSDYEGFGLPVLEAMACGCPVVAAPTSSLPEVGGSAARYATSQNGEAYAAELAAYFDSGVRRTAVAAGLARAAEFSWEKTMRKTAAVYLAR